MKKLFKQMRNEWRTNIWLALELLVVSVVMWYCVDYLWINVSTLNEPRGHDIDHAYLVQVEELPSSSPDYVADNVGNPADRKTLAERMRSRPEVEAAAWSLYSIPYIGACMSCGMEDEEPDSLRRVHLSGYSIYRWVQPEYFRVYRVSGVRGETPEQLAERMRPGQNVVGVAGNTFCDANLNRIENTADYIGRKFTLSEPNQTLAFVTPAFKRFDWESAFYDRGIWSLMGDNSLGQAKELSVRLRANMDDGTFIDRLMADSESQYRIGNLYIRDVQRMADVRTHAQTEWFTDIRNMVIGIAFLMLNVFLGLLGSFWFRTQQRVSEIAIHKINGATRAQVFGRLIMEGVLLLVIVTPVALLIDYVLADREMTTWAVEGYFEAARMAKCAALTFGLITLMIATGIYFPARRAMSIAPAEAIRAD